MTGTDQTGVVEREKDVLPLGWFPRLATPVLDTVLNGVASVGAWAYALLQYVRAQTRLSTSTDGFLELAALDYFGDGQFPRLSGETDAQYTARIAANILPTADTRQVISDAIRAVTGKTPRIVEPWYPSDTGVWDGHQAGGQTAGCFFWNVDTPTTPFRWTSVRRRFQAFIDTTFPTLPLLGDNVLPSWDTNYFFWGAPGSSLMEVGGAVPIGNQVVYDAILRKKVEGTVIWVRRARS